MNNSKITLYSESEGLTNRLENLEKQQGEWTQIVEALNRVESSQDWQKLKRLFLDGVLVTLENQLKGEASKSELNLQEIYRLQGQLVWAKKYADLKKLSDFFRKQVENLNNQIKHDKYNPADGAA